MGSSNQAKEALRGKKYLLQKYDGYVLGKKFRNQIVEMTKTRKTTSEAFSAGKSKSGCSRRESFPEASQRKHQQKWRVAGRQIFLFRAPNYQNNKQKWQQQNSSSNLGERYQRSSQRGERYGKIEQKSSPLACLRCYTNSGGRSQAGTSHCKMIILEKGFTKPSPARETQTFSEELITRDPNILGLVKGFKILLLSQPVQDYVPKIPRNDQDTERTGASRDRDKLEKRSNILDRS